MSRSRFALFDSCKNTGWLARCLSQYFKFSLRTNVSYTFDGATPWSERLENKRKIEGLSHNKDDDDDDDDDDDGDVRAGTDSETALRDAFVMFDEEKKGKLSEE